MATQQEKACQGANPTSEGLLFGEDEDLGVGSGANERRRQEDMKLMAILGRKLQRARKLARMSESAAGLALSHEGVTQISLYENGRRFPSLVNLRLLAKLYGVTIDYLLDMHDDILAEPEEGNQAVLRGVFSEALSGQFCRFVEVIANRNAMITEGLSVDRVLLRETGALASDLVSALDVVKRHAPDFEGLRGGAKLARLVGELHVSMGKHAKRHKLEQALIEHEQFVPAPEVIVARVQQLFLEV